MENSQIRNVTDMSTRTTNSKVRTYQQNFGEVYLLTGTDRIVFIAVLCSVVGVFAVAGNMKSYLHELMIIILDI